MKTLKSYPSENPRVWGWPPWPSLGCFENPDLPWALSVSAFHPPSPPLPSAVRLCHLCPEGLLCSWTKDCGAWRPYCLESDCLTPNTAKACPHEKMAHQKAWSKKCSGPGASRVLRLTLPALASTSAFFCFLLGTWSVVYLELKPCLELFNEDMNFWGTSQVSLRRPAG